MRRKYASDLTRGFPTIVIAVAVFAALLGDIEERYVFTFAGTGEAGAGGDGGPAAEAQLNSPEGLELDGSGNLYVADTLNRRIRRIDAEGVITTIAGTGEPGFSGDGGPAAEAQLTWAGALALDEVGINLACGRRGPNPADRCRGSDHHHRGNGRTGIQRGRRSGGGGATHSGRALALDGSGNLYAADGGRIRRIDAEGVITTIAGTGEPGFSGDGGPAAEAQLQLGRRAGVRRVPTSTWPTRATTESGGSDAGSDHHHPAGTGEPGFSGDGGPAAEAQSGGSSNLYVADTLNRRIRRIDPEGVITTIAGSGRARPPVAITGTAVRRRGRNSLVPARWRWTGRATSMRTRSTIGSGSSDRRPRSFRTSTMSRLHRLRLGVGEPTTVTPAGFYSSKGDPISADSLDGSGRPLRGRRALARIRRDRPLAART